MAPELPNPIHPEVLSRLDADFVDYYNANFAWKPPSHSVTIADVRSQPARFDAPWCRDFRFEPFVRDMKIMAEDGHEVTVRCYEPDPRTSPFGEGPYPVHINAHGGGFCFGDLKQDADLCMLMRNRAGIKIIDVDYRLTPEHTYLRSHDDVWAVIKWVHEHGDVFNIRPGSMSIGGISAGGHITAVCQQLARDAGIHLKLAIVSAAIVTDMLDLGDPAESPYPSRGENRNAPWLTWDRIKFFAGVSAPKDDAEKAELEARPRFVRSPIDGDLSGVCDTFIAVADCDPLRDEAEAYGRKLIAAGVKTTTRRYLGAGHVFMLIRTLEKAKMYVDDVVAELKRVHGA